VPEEVFAKCADQGGEGGLGRRIGDEATFPPAAPAGRVAAHVANSATRRPTAEEGRTRAREPRKLLIEL